MFMLDSFPDCELSVDRLPDRSLCVEKRGPRGGREEKPASEEQALALSTRIRANLKRVLAFARAVPLPGGPSPAYSARQPPELASTPSPALAGPPRPRASRVLSRVSVP